MTPPTCAVCDRENDSGTTLVTFADYRPLPPGMVGHPEGQEWICSKHLDDARALTHLASDLALEQLQGRGLWLRVLKLAVWVTSAIWFAVAARLAYAFDWSATGLCIAASLAWLGVDLWRMRSWARSVSKALLGGAVVLDILAVFGPFYGLDHPAGSYGGAIPWRKVLFIQVPFLTVTLALFAVLDRHGAQFRKRQPRRASPRDVS